MTRPTRADPGGRAYLDLQNRARREGRLTQELLILYVLERFLARLFASRHTGTFVLKGGMLLAVLGTLSDDAGQLPEDLATLIVAVADFADPVLAGPPIADSRWQAAWQPTRRAS